MKWRGESGVLASDVVRGKNPKTFQFLSFPFIASQAVETGMRGDPKKSAHPPVNTARSRPPSRKKETDRRRSRGDLVKFPAHGKGYLNDIICAGFVKWNSKTLYA